MAGQLTEKDIHLNLELVALSEAQKLGICPEETIVRVAVIKNHDGELMCGLESRTRIDHWHDLNGQLKEGHGFWVSISTIGKTFKKYENIKGVLISDDYIFKGRNLKGMPCIKLFKNERTHELFVEFEENIGAGSADGRGKTGHCLNIPLNIATIIYEEEIPKTKSKIRIAKKVEDM